MADLILDLKGLHDKAAAAGCNTTATTTVPSLCPLYNKIADYVSGGSSVVSISGTYSNNLLVPNNKVTIAKLENPVTVSARNSTYDGNVHALLNVSNLPLGSQFYCKVNNGNWVNNYPGHTEAGTYTIYWYCSGTDVYLPKNSRSSPGQVTATIAKKSRTMSWTTTRTGLEYGSGGAIAATPSEGASDGTITYSSSNTGIAYISNRNYVYAGQSSSATGSTCTITATISGGANYSDASCNYTITCYNRYNGHGYVDLGLSSGTLWATTNVGASNAWDYGNYYKYGWTTAYNSSLTEYTGSENPLSLTKDAARQNWGGLWHMPTYSLILELLNETTSTWTTLGSGGLGVSGGIYGRKFTSKKDSNKWIFIPAASFYGATGNAPTNLGTSTGLGRYWSNTPSSTTGKRWNLYISYAVVSTGDDYPRAGYSVRPVCG